MKNQIIIPLSDETLKKLGATEDSLFKVSVEGQKIILELIDPEPTPEEK